MPTQVFTFTQDQISFFNRQTRLYSLLLTILFGGANFLKITKKTVVKLGITLFQYLTQNFKNWLVSK